MREEHFQLDQLGNRKQVSQNGGAWQQWTRRDNGLNQINSAPTWHGPLTYEDNYSPQTATCNNANTVTDGSISAYYDALNRPLWMWGLGRGANGIINFEK